MFWETVKDQSINDILTNPDVTLEEVLDHEYLLQDCKLPTKSIVEYFTSEDIITKMVNYVLSTPSESIEENIRFKYPNLVSEVLTSNICEISDELISSKYGKPSYIKLFFEKLSSNEPLNPLILSFSIKIILNLLRYDNDVVMDHLIEISDSIDLLLKHVQINAIVWFFEEFIKTDVEISTKRLEWLKQHNLVLKCAKCLDNNIEINNSIESIFSMICKFVEGNDITDQMKEMLLDQLNSPDYMELLIDHVTDVNSKEDLKAVSLMLLRSVINLNINRKLNMKFEKCIDLIEDDFGIFVNFLSDPPKQMLESIPSSFGVYKPFGRIRIEIIGLITAFIKLQNDRLNNCIIHSNILNVIFSLLTSFPWNSKFHLTFLQLCQSLFMDLTPDSHQMPLIHFLITDFDIYQWYIDVVHNHILNGEKPRRGFGGVMWKLGQMLDDLVESEESKTFLAGTDNVREVWCKVRENYLDGVNANNKLDLTGGASAYDELEESMKFAELSFTEINSDEMDMFEKNTEAFGDLLSASRPDLDDFFNACNNRPQSRDEMFPTRQTDSPNDDKSFDEISLPVVDDSDWPDISLDIPKSPCDEEESTNNCISEDETIDSDSSDEENYDSPATIKQQTKGKAAKYVVSKFVSQQPADIQEAIVQFKIRSEFCNNKPFKPLSDPWSSELDDCPEDAEDLFTNVTGTTCGTSSTEKQSLEDNKSTVEWANFD